MEIDVLRGVSGTEISARFGLGRGTTIVNRIAMTALHHITNSLLLANAVFVLVIFMMFFV